MKNLLAGLVVLVGLGMTGCGQIQMTSTSVDVQGSNVSMSSTIKQTSTVGSSSTAVQNKVTLPVGQIAALHAIATNEDGTNSTVFWSSSNEGVVHVDYHTGLINGVGKGIAVVTASSAKDDTIVMEATVVVK